MARANYQDSFPSCSCQIHLFHVHSLTYNACSFLEYLTALQPYSHPYALLHMQFLTLWRKVLGKEPVRLRMKCPATKSDGFYWLRDAPHPQQNLRSACLPTKQVKEEKYLQGRVKISIHNLYLLKFISHTLVHFLISINSALQYIVHIIYPTIALSASKFSSNHI